MEELEQKAAEVLESLVESITDTPQALLALYALLHEQYKTDPQAIEKLDQFARNFISRIPELTRIVSDSARVLETYLSFKASMRQEEATKSLLEQNKILVKHNRILSYATVLLAISTFSLVIVTVVLHL